MEQKRRERRKDDETVGRYEQNPRPWLSNVRALLRHDYQPSPDSVQRVSMLPVVYQCAFEPFVDIVVLISPLLLFH